MGGSIENMRASGAPDSRNQAYWAAYERLVALLAARPDLRVRTIREIQEAALPDQAPTLNADEVRALATALAAAPSLPLSIGVGSRWVTLAEALTALEAAVVAGSVPASTATRALLGLRADAAASGALTLARPDLVRAAQAGAARDGDFIRSTVSVGARSVNAAEYLVALASLVAQDFPSEVRLAGRGLYPEGTSAVHDTLTRLQLWTYKPARFEG